MPFGDVVNQIPAPVFLLIHGVAFLIGAYFASRAFNAGASLLGLGLQPLRAGRDQLHDLPRRLDDLPVRAPHQRSARSGRLHPRVRGGRTQRAGHGASLVMSRLCLRGRPDGGLPSSSSPARLGRCLGSAGGHRPGRPAALVQVRSGRHHGRARDHRHLDQQRPVHPLGAPCRRRWRRVRRSSPARASRTRSSSLACATTTARSTPMT